MGSSKTFKNKVKDLRNENSIKRPRWNVADDQRLESLFREGVGISLIALNMHRTEIAIVNRARKLELYPRKTKAKRTDVNNNERHIG